MEKVHEKQRNVWVLGGTGFIGKSLLNHLASDPLNRIHVLVHRSIPYRHLEKFNIITGSLGRFDLKWFDRYPPDLVFHLARMAGPGPLRRRLASRRGERANQRLIRYFRSMVQPPVVVYVSGSLMYGDQSEGKVADETFPVNPVAFGRDYIRAERPWMRESGKSGLTVKLVRPGWIVGPGSWFRVFFWNHYLRTGRVPVYGEGSQLMSLVHVDDLGAMIGKVPNFDPEVMNLFAGDPVTQNDFTIKMAEILGAKRESVSLKQVRKQFGKAEAEALSVSIPLATGFPEVWKEHGFLYPGPGDMLMQVISLLQAEQGVFAEPPAGGAGQQLIGFPQ